MTYQLTPKHRLHQTFEPREGFPQFAIHDHYSLTADEALAQRVKRLKEAGTPHEVDGHTLTYEDESGKTTLYYGEAR
ncbi:hypothetical protein [Zhihengliuella halotolerans]|uniref:hypothetical protein n=1 Tax=Zhihengliuella halotolerans TaxID=370736 RepID=UPI000C8039B4|nr:hypothetical protein [Zhihengliuella halotolerans]